MGNEIDNNKNLKTLVFRELDSYARYCCRTYHGQDIPKVNCNDNALTQMAYYVWIPKEYTTWVAVKLSLNVNFNPSYLLNADVAKDFCGKGMPELRHFALITASSTEHTEKTLLP